MESTTRDFVSRSYWLQGPPTALEERQRTTSRAETGLEQYLECVGSDVSSERYDRVVERRRAVALARHFRVSEGLTIAQIAERLGRAPATVKAYFYDPS